MYAPKEILKQFNIAKQAADLHSNFFCQKILHRYLMDHDLDTHLRNVVSVYRKNCQQMSELLDDLLPQLEHTMPEGGMFLIARLPQGLSSRRIFSEGVKKKVAVLPGLPFYVDGGGDDIIRMNFSSASEEQIREGLHRLARVIKDCQQG
jgi:2-aminoadipate transaminase